MAYIDSLLKDTTSKIVTPKIFDTAGAGKTGLAFGDVTASYIREGGTRVAITLASGTAGDAYSSGKWAEVDSTNCKGVYQLHVPNAAFATGVDSVDIVLQATGAIDTRMHFNLVEFDVQSSTNLGLSALPTANPDATGGLPIVDANGRTAADIEAISGDATAADNLELQYDTTGITGDTFPSTQAQMNNISSSSAAIATNTKSSPDGFVYTTVTSGSNEVNNEDETRQLDAVYHSLEPGTTDTDCHYIFDVGGNGVPVSVKWWGFVNSNGDSYSVHAWNYTGTPQWDQVGTIVASNGTIVNPEVFELTTDHVGTGANIGEVKLRFYSTDGTKITTDRIICNYTNTSQSVGYSNGSIWVDENGIAGSEVYVNGTADNPCPWANALVLSAALDIKKFTITNGTTITLDATTQEYILDGTGWFLALGGQDIASSYFHGAVLVSGVSSGATQPMFENCLFDGVTIPAAFMKNCGLGAASGTFTAAVGSGQYLFEDCFSIVPGSGSPAFDFSPATGTMGINNRRWAGGATYTLDANCVLSHEVLAGGGTTITTGGADVEIRGITRSVTLILSAAETAQFVGTTGPITLSGTTTATVNLYGVSASIADTTITATVNDHTVNQANINTEVDNSLETYKLDHLVAVADSDDPVNDSIMAKLASSGGDWSTFVSSTDALQAIRDQGDSSWVTGGDATAANQTTIISDIGALNDITAAEAGTDAASKVLATPANLLVTDGSGQTTDINSVAIKAKTDLIPADPATVTNQTTILNRLGSITGTGVNTVLGFFKSLLSKTASTPSDIGGTFSAATDSTEAIRDQGDAAWTTGAGSGGDATEANQTAIIADIAALNDITAADAGTDAASKVLAIPANLLVTDSSGQTTDINSVAIKAKTDLIPADPATVTNQSTIISDIAALNDITVDEVWDEILSKASHDIAQSAGKRLRQLTDNIVHSDTAQGPGANGNQIVLDTGASAVDGTYDPGIISLVGGTGAGQSRMITQYDGSSKTVTVNRTWKVLPDATTDFIIVSSAGFLPVNEGLVQSGTSTTVTLNVLASSVDGAYDNQIIFISSGTGEDQSRRIVSYDGTTKIATVNRAWDTTPDSTSNYFMLPTLVFEAADNTTIATIDTNVDAIKVQTDKMTFDGSNNIRSNMYELQTTSLAKFSTEDTGETTPVAGSVAQLAQGAAGGNVTVGAFTTDALKEMIETDTGLTLATDGSVAQIAQGEGAWTEDQINTVINNTNKIGGAAISVSGPVTATGNIEVVRGDDYLSSAGSSLVWSSDGWPDLTGATVVFTTRRYTNYEDVITDTADVTDPGTGSQTITVELTTLQTTGLKVGEIYQFDIQATLASGAIRTLTVGTLTVIKDFTH